VIEDLVKTLGPDSWSEEDITDSIHTSHLLRHFNCDLRPLKSGSYMNVMTRRFENTLNTYMKKFSWYFWEYANS